ncbi:potassium channel family protein [Aliikangiella coralliicola]|uniref:Two pore domain potassium channel family protein n=1 Tax=Aliikangiella coralliicola TaxID=2592383 RepID=A0A545U913_9GAMM|nr:potassium channel family protein [Aliikangiella coralliicola]TQV85958.1 two pore domain potassium channel family protein [Aliikangiella coralliicola]
MAFTLTFIKLFFWITYLVSPLLLLLCFIVIVLGQWVASIEKWNRFDALYWTFITATTVGYGDIRPLKKASKVISVLIAFLGLMFTGILVAVTLNTASVAFEKHIDEKELNKLKQEFNSQLAMKESFFSSKISRPTLTNKQINN